MPLPEAAAAHYRRMQRVQMVAITGVAASWARMTPDVDASWPAVRDRAVPLVESAQLAAARSGASYVPLALAEQGLTDDPLGAVETAALAGIAADGRPLDSLLFGAVVHTKDRLAAGVDIAQALAAGGIWLEGAARTQVSDAGRGAAGLAIAATPRAGWTRMVNPPCCGRCAVLAGKTFKWNEGFLRHPRCDCTHVPTPEVGAGNAGTSPLAAFEAMSRAEQDKAFTKAGARAIRDGADPSQVVNARRSASGMSRADGGRGQLERRDTFGQQLYVTTEGTTRRGAAYQSLTRGRGTDVRTPGQRLARAQAPRLMPESIYDIATDREDAVRLLKANGYLRP